jgi:ribosomal peptide maturation radical SAM protein 1
VRIVLVSMPWASLEFPSLALGILKRRVGEELPDAEVRVVDGNIEFVDWLSDRVPFSREDYDFYATSYFSGHSEWIFSSALYNDVAWRRKEFSAYMAEHATSEQVATTVALHEVAPDFAGQLAERIVAEGADVVGFTSTFQQNTAALAVARCLKDVDPRVVTVLGGGNCEGPQGEALHRNFPFVDLVLRGEAELSFPQLLRALAGGGSLADVPGLCWRPVGGGSVANPMSSTPLPPDVLVTPDFDGYFERRSASRVAAWCEPKLVVESSRGCWWGEKHHCTFCGLNGTLMMFRSKSPGAFVDDLLALVERHRVLDVFVVDNILDMQYLHSALPRLQESGYDLRLQYEIKSNLRREQLQVMRDAGVTHVQPGIENLNSTVLRLMDKGVTGVANVRLLRDAEDVGVFPVWNYLYGFPGETDAEYEDVLDQLPALHHLAPPGGVVRLEIERFSPYFDRPELGFPDLLPSPHYRLIYDLPESELRDLAYVFEAAPQGIGGKLAARLHEAVDRWVAVHPDSRLTACPVGDAVVLVNTRPGFAWRTLRVTDPVEVAALALLEQPHSIPSLARKLAATFPVVGETSVISMLRRWRRLGLVFEECGRFIALPVEAANQDLLRLGRSALDPAPPPLAPALPTAV